MHICKKRFIMEAELSQDLLSTGSWPRTSCWCFSLSPKARGKTSAPGRRQSLGGGSAFCSEQAFQCWAKAHPRGGGSPALPGALTRIFVASRNILNRHAQNYVWPNVLAPVAQGNWHMKLANPMSIVIENWAKFHSNWLHLEQSEEALERR